MGETLGTLFGLVLAAGVAVTGHFLAKALRSRNPETFAGERNWQSWQSKVYLGIGAVGWVAVVALGLHGVLKLFMPAWGDARIGHSASGPFDSIVAAAGGEDIPRAWMDQLAPGGRLVAPTAAGGRGQVLVVLDHVVEAGVSRWVRSEHEAVLFVPLKSGVV